MVNKGNHPQMALIQVGEILYLRAAAPAADPGKIASKIIYIV